MHVFVSWSGKRSKIVAEYLESWLRQVIQALDPWISSDISKGLRWSPEISARLESSKVGIICLTKENIDSKWILFEAGALSKTKDAHACTLLLGLNSTDIEYPLAQFQHTTTEKNDFKQLLMTINSAVAKCNEKSLPDNTLDEIFETYWPRLEQKFNEIKTLGNADNTPTRTDTDLLVEILETVRNQERKINGLESKVLSTITVNRVSDIFSRRTKDGYINDLTKHQLNNYIKHCLYSIENDFGPVEILKNGDSDLTSDENSNNKKV